MSTLGLPTAITTAPDSPYRDCRSRARNQLGWSASEVTLCVVQREPRNPPPLMHEYYIVTTPRQDPTRFSRILVTSPLGRGRVRSPVTGRSSKGE